MSIKIICSLAVLFTSITIIAIAFLFLRVLTMLREEVHIYNERKEREFLLGLDIDAESINLLDPIIQETLHTYVLVTYEQQEQVYFNEEHRVELVRIIMAEVLKKLSPVLMEKLSLIYNREVLEDEIYRKVNIVVLSYVVEKNTTLTK